MRERIKIGETVGKSEILRGHDLLQLYFYTTWHLLVKEVRAQEFRMVRKHLSNTRSGESEVLEQVFGSTMYFDVRSMHDVLMWNLIRRGQAYEPSTTRLILSKLKPGNTFVDIGANNGYFSLLASAVVGKQGHVFAFEPTPWTLVRLFKNVRSGYMSNIAVVPKALWSVAGTLPIYFSAQGDSMNSLIPKTLDILSTSEGQTTVETTTIDSCFPKEDIHLMKIDAEGAEIEILKGARSAIMGRRIKSLVVEWAPVLSRRVTDWDRKFSYFRSLGEIYEISDARGSYSLRGPIERRKELSIFGANLLVTIEP